MWTYEDVEGLMTNVTVRRKYKDGVHKQSQLLAHNGYVLHLLTDNGYTDEETGVYYPPMYSYQVTTSGDNEANIISQYEAVLIEPGMDIVSAPNVEEII